MRIGFVGLGNMGNPMAVNLIKSGHQLTVHDLRREAATNLLEMGASWAGSPAQAARDNELVLTSLPMPRDVEAVALGEGGILEGAAGGTVFADLSTNSPTMVRRIHQAGGERGVFVLDAPVSGGVYGAADGTLAVMVGGDEAIYRSVKPILEAIGNNVLYCGAIGNGMVCKLCNNLVSMGIGLLVTEALTLGVKAGVDLALLTEVLGKSSGGNVRLQRRMPRFLFKGNFEPGFTADMAAKDVRLATDMGRELGLPMELSNMVDQRHVEALARGWGRRDADIVSTLQEERTGVQLRLPD